MDEYADPPRQPGESLLWLFSRPKRLLEKKKHTETTGSHVRGDEDG